MKGMVGKKNSSWTVFIIVSVLLISTVTMYFCFLYYSKNIRATVVKQEINQIELTSNYITKIFHTEMEDCVDVLRENARAYYLSDAENTLEDTVEFLQNIKEHTDFTVVGVIRPDGWSMNDSGIQRQLRDRAVLQAILKNEIYVSDLLISGEKKLGKILIAVPIHENGRAVGAIWGRYPIDVIAKKVEETGDRERNFYIIDDKGAYISRSSDLSAWNGSTSIWDELGKCSFPQGDTVESIRSRVENHESGIVCFRVKDGSSRYATFRPLGINNWYIFSVLAGSSPDRYIGKIREFTIHMLSSLTCFLGLWFFLILLLVYRNKKTTERQNSQLEVKTELFRMVMGKTKNIPFEINTSKKWLKLYHGEDGQPDYEMMDDFSPEFMLKNGKIRSSDLAVYQRIYDTAIEGRDSEPVILEMDMGKGMTWMRIHLVTVNSDSVIGYLEDYAEQMRKSQELEAVSQKTKYDVLTGLYNRETFITSVEEVLKKPQAMMSALFLLDLDHFKDVNDILGHMTGDRVLQEMAQNLKSAIRSRDLSGRVGGDEFMVFIQDAADTNAIKKCAEKMNRILQRPYEKDSKRVKVSASIGIAVAEEGVTFRELYERADKALYDVKKNGRNGYSIYAGF